MIIVLFGVSGAGKTLIGRRLAARLQWEFIEGDDYHPHSNIEKMRHGIPLDDHDREPWLSRLHDLITSRIQAGRSAVISCSALKARYRRQLRGNDAAVRFVYLKGDYATLEKRLLTRQDHYMKADLLHSQLQVLEEPGDGLVIDIQRSPETIVDTIVRHFNLTGGTSGPGEYR